MASGYYTNFCLLSRGGGERLDKTLAALFPAHPRAALRELIERGAVRLDGAPALRPARRAKGGEEIGADFSALPVRRGDEVAAENLPLAVIYEDRDILVINKPAGIVMHPGRGNRDGTVQAALLFRNPPAAALPRGGIVHRLDKDTTGLFVAAKTEAARLSLLAQFKSRSVRREYLALAHGAPDATGIVNRPLAPHRNAPGKMAVRHKGKEAVTRFAVVRRWKNFSLLRCWLETGRTHQIRAHLEYAGYPIAGDPAYSRRARDLPFGMPRQALHAEVLHLTHPKTGEELTWRAPLPEDMQAALDFLDRAARA
ncbi:MAG: RluA family pseudouridine synthase [Gammaproteobacteria bacterium]